MATDAAIVGIDTGGTFTDIVACIGSRILTLKVLSTPSNPAVAVLTGMRELLGDVVPWVVTYGSTVATNALLERRGARVVLVTTDGFEDVIEIGRQNRPALYDLEPQRPAPLVAGRDRLGVDERMAFDGEVLKPLTRTTLARALRRVERLRPQSIAVCLLHSYVNPAHERRLGAALRKACGVPCSLSHELVPECREYERMSTTVINAYVQPTMRRHLEVLQRSLKGSRLRVMQSNGGAVSARQAGAEAVRTVLSGPAGGVIGAWRVARALGIERIITFDMGGTSTDVSLVDGTLRHRTEWEIGGLPIKVAALDIHTVGAGGGSLARVDAGGALKVGPESAGADPGPACYGRGTMATVTDANLCLGRLSSGGFLDGRMSLGTARARRALSALAKRMRCSVERAAEGVAQVANASMERAIRRISIERGHDPRDYAMIAFGGAAGQHACELAAALGIKRVVAPAYPGLLSAWGSAAAETQRDYAGAVRLTNPRSSELRRRFAPLERRAAKALDDERIPQSARRLERSLDARYAGQSHEIRLPLTRDYVEAFHAEHERLYGYADRERPVEIVQLRLFAIGAGPALPTRQRGTTPATVPPRQRVRWRGRWLAARVLHRSALRPGSALSGPAIVTELSATTFIPPGWHAVPSRGGHLEIVHGR